MISSDFIWLFATIQASLSVCVLILISIQGPKAAKAKLWSSRILLGSSVLIPIIYFLVFRYATPAMEVSADLSPQVITELDDERIPSVNLAIPEQYFGDIVVEASSQVPQELGLLLSLAVLGGLAAYVRQRRRLFRLVTDSHSVRRFRSVDIRLGTCVQCPVAFSVNGQRFILLDPRTNSCSTLRKNAIAHEIQHHRHLDPVFSHLVSIVVFASWVNPVSWLLPRLCRNIDEYACDIGVTGRPSIRSSEYVESLLTIARNSKTKQLWTSNRLVHSMAESSRKSILRRRVEFLLSERKQPSLRWTLLTYVITLAGLTSIACGSRSQRNLSLKTPTLSQAKPAKERTTRIDGWFLGGSDPYSYEIGLDTVEIHSGSSSGTIRSIATQSSGFGTMMQTIDASPYLGKRVQLTAFIKTRDVESWAGLWMRVDSEDRKGTAFDNMRNRPIQGTTEWTQYSIVLDVPNNATSVNFGVLLHRLGTLWIDSVSLEPVTKAVPRTSSNLQKATNLKFEK